MPISKYPRRGQRIAPSALIEILDVALPRHMAALSTSKKLMDLDETTWAKFNRSTCIDLANVVVERVRASIPALPYDVRCAKLPAPPDGFTLEDLDLEIRTWNCLLAAGFDDDLGRLASWTIDDLLKLRSFGAKSLVDLLSSLESHQAAPNKQYTLPEIPIEGATRPKRRLSRQLTKLARHLRQALQVRQITQGDPRFGRLLRSVDRSAKSVREIADSLIDRDNDPRNCQAYCKRLEALIHGINVASKLPLDEEMMGLAGIEDVRRIAILSRYFAWDGGKGCTLQEIANEYGVTRQRVAQICGRASSLKQRKVYAPTLERALRIARSLIPCPAEDIEQQLELQRIARCHIRLEGLINAARFAGREPHFNLVEDGEARLAVGEEDRHLPKLILQVANKTVQRWGAATVADIGDQVSEGRDKPLSAHFVSHVLVARQDLCWLEEQRTLFWFSDVPRNSLFTQIKKTIAVARHIHVGELRAAVSRHHRRHGFAPPRRVLLALCKQLPHIEVNGEIVSAYPPLELAKTLPASELLIVNTLMEHGPVMPRPQLEEMCVAQGMSRGTFFVCLDYSPAIVRFARGVFGLRGAAVPPGVVESLIPKSRLGRVMVDYGWDQHSRVWVLYKASEGMILRGAAAIPRRDELDRRRTFHIEGHRRFAHRHFDSRALSSHRTR